MPSKVIGNQFWKLRTKHGKDKLFSDGAALLEEAHAYMDWCDNNPVNKIELVKYKGRHKNAKVPHARPYTMVGLTRYLGVSGSYFRTAKGSLREKVENGTATASEVGLLDAIEEIEQVVKDQQITGALVGLYNPSVTARLNGLVDRQDITSNGGAVLRVTVRDQETADNLKELDELL